MEILIDTREPKNRKFNALCTYKEHEGAMVQLESGDYVFDDEVAFEYKTISDFINSVINKRIFKQITKQVDSYKYNYLIIVGNERDKIDAFIEANQYTRFNRKRYDHAIMDLSSYVSIVYADYEIEALEKMLYIAEKTLKNKVTKPVKVSKNPVVNYLSCIDHINTITASRIVHELSITTLNELLNMSKKDLLRVQGVGDKTAERILNGIK